MRLLEAIILATALYKDIRPVVNQILSCINGPELHLLRFLTFFNRIEVCFALHIKLCCCDMHIKQAFILEHLKRR